MISFLFCPLLSPSLAYCRRAPGYELYSRTGHELCLSASAAALAELFHPRGAHRFAVADPAPDCRGRRDRTHCKFQGAGTFQWWQIIGNKVSVNLLVS